MIDEKRKRILVSISYMILASLLIAATTILAKTLGTDKLGAPLNPLQISNSRFFFAFILITIIFIKTKTKVIKPNIKIHLARSCAGWLGISILFGASSIIPVSDATALIFTNPIFTMLLAIPILGERIKSIKWLAALITFVGAIILIRPENNTIAIEPIILLLILGAVILGLESIFIKMLTNFENPVQILFINNGIGLFISLIPLYFIWQNPTYLQIFAMFGIGALMLCAQSCFIQALKRGEAHFVVPYFYSTLIFVTFYDFLIFEIIPDKISVFGATIIILGGLTMYLSEIKIKLIKS